MKSETRNPSGLCMECRKPLGTEYRVVGRAPKDPDTGARIRSACEIQRSGRLHAKNHIMRQTEGVQYVNPGSEADSLGHVQGFATRIRQNTAKKRLCLRCGELFESASFANRLCQPCKAAANRQTRHKCVISGRFSRNYMED